MRTHSWHPFKWHQYQWRCTLTVVFVLKRAILDCVVIRASVFHKHILFRFSLTLNPDIRQVFHSALLKVFVLIKWCWEKTRSWVRLPHIVYNVVVKYRSKKKKEIFCVISVIEQSHFKNMNYMQIVCLSVNTVYLSKSKWWCLYISWAFIEI